MEIENLFMKFSVDGKCLLPDTTLAFKDIPWTKHKTWEGVALKHLITSKETEGQFSFHLVRIEPYKAISKHVHEKQIETHEVIAGSGICINNDTELTYEPGVISIMRMNVPHEVVAGSDGLYLFAKFMPALV
ncbi:MAG TPA: cupin [Thermotogota bacterium]|nr:cupin [Thermotogota bacterium]